MTENFLEKLVEHHNWANARIIDACSTRADAQLDAAPTSATEGTIRHTLTHLVGSQQSYLSYLTGTDLRSYWSSPPPFAELRAADRVTGQALLDLARDPSRIPTTWLETRRHNHVAPWLVVVQIINHATEHREQIKSMLTALGVTPPEIDGWSYGEVTHALVPPAPQS